jgi:hypothetical protein
MQRDHTEPHGENSLIRSVNLCAISLYLCEPALLQFHGSKVDANGLLGR